MVFGIPTEWIVPLHYEIQRFLLYFFRPCPKFYWFVPTCDKNNYPRTCRAHPSPQTFLCLPLLLLEQSKPFPSGPAPENLESSPQTTSSKLAQKLFVTGLQQCEQRNREQHLKAFWQFSITPASKHVTDELVLLTRHRAPSVLSDLGDELDIAWAVLQPWAIGPLLGSWWIGNENKSGLSPQRVWASVL